MWLNEKGIVLMGVGVLYLVFGFILTRVRHCSLKAKKQIGSSEERKRKKGSVREMCANGVQNQPKPGCSVTPKCCGYRKLRPS